MSADNGILTQIEIEKLIAEFKRLPTPIIGDCMERLVGTHSLKAFHGKAAMCGVARTVRVAAGDNLFIHHALNMSQPGDVIVVEGGGDVQRALVGELMMLFAKSRGVAGFVIDGAIRDASTFRAHEFPCFAAGQTLRGPYKNGPGAAQVTVTIDGMTVSPGDLIVGDEDGVIAVPRGNAETILTMSKATLAKEQETKREIAQGTVDRSWVDKRIAAL
ncbi:MULTISPECIES: RraA family protein [Ensifer]|jgi:RraA family protein|uniref:RraA family protein n=1 Tax=Ensifer TaxID=106591 RepID=UPI00071271AA|nr:MULTISPECIES: RraA family protein [Ensifer]KQX43238.1 dimethylmenaquinone methyltransferase [Ensifer sp. Root1298]KQX72786.1 dimethylmenaquinone methyltransferase [Ensifer sp. Root1312]KRC15752.1 dimethylmenaquinone methyltransferase [Ensifer sp. Root74]KRD59027.1 dimethylmenaquinone methyltransferase [Ensifer sp. Root954]